MASVLSEPYFHDEQAAFEALLGNMLGSDLAGCMVDEVEAE